MLGAGVSISTSPYEGADAQVIPLPIIYLEKDRFFIRGIRAGYAFYDTKPYECALFVQPRFMGYESGDSDMLADMEDRDWSLDAGLSGSWDIPWIPDSSLSAALLQDTLDKSNGRELQLIYKQLFDMKPFFVRPSFGVIWQSEDLVDYYYGVKDFEAKANRPHYAPDACVNYYAGVDMIFYVAPQWALVSRVGIDIFGDEVKDSPIVGDSYQANFIAGAVYSF
jgi:outer membrane protein